MPVSAPSLTRALDRLSSITPASPRSRCAGTWALPGLPSHGPPGRLEPIERAVFNQSGFKQMLYDVLKDRSFANLMQKHIIEILTNLFDQNQNFGILCKIETLTFDPPLPADITAEFRPMTLFFLAGYTFESARIENNNVIFE